MQQTTIKIVTANVQGLSDDSKRLKLLSHWSKSTSASIFLLTETKCTDQRKAARWNADCTSFGFASSFTEDSSTAILWRSANPHIADPNIPEPAFPSSLLRRLSTKTLQIGTQTVRFHSVYCPVDPSERPAFIELLRKELQRTQQDIPVALGGDWNVVLEPLLDSSKAASQNVGCQQLSDLVASMQLSDPFRRLYGAKRTFTNIHPVGANRRLDRFYVSPELCNSAQSFDTWSRYHSTHHPVVMTWSVPGAASTGPGFFKLSNHVIERPGMSDYLTSLVDRIYQQSRLLHNDDIYAAWDDCKAKLSLEVQYLARKLAQHERRVTTDRNRSEHVGRAIRARLRPDDCGPSSVQIRLRQVRQNSLISKLETGEQVGATTCDPGEMAEIARKHFAGIFCDKPNDSEMHDLLAFVPEAQKLSNSDSNELEYDYELEELTKAMKKCNRGRSPSHSGLPIEFYKATWQVTGPILLDILNDIPNRGVMTPSQRYRFLNLAHKKGERHKIENYRPLASIEADARILSQAHVQRLKVYIRKIIGETQTGFIPQRWIGSNISEIQRVIDDEAEFPGIIAAVDFTSAYDMVNHMYLEESLLAFGFGPRAISWFMATVRDIDVSVLVNGWVSGTFHQYTGASQGCPLACLIFSIAIEPLACMIRAKVAGIPHPIAPMREKLFADDLFAGLKDWNDFHALEECLELYETASNAVVSTKKSFLYPLGTFQNQRGTDYSGWRIETQPFRCLGITVGRGTSLPNVWEGMMLKVKRRMNSIPMYDLPIATRCRIINTFCYSMIYYVDQFAPATWEAVKRIEADALDAIWRGRSRTISMQRLQTPCLSGGFGLANLYKQLVGRRAVWVCWLLQPEAYLKGPFTSVIWRVNGDLVRKPHCVGMQRNRNTFQLEGGFRWNWTALFTQPGDFKAEQSSTVMDRLTATLPARWHNYLDAWNELVVLKPHLNNRAAWHQHFCTARYNRLNIDIKLDKLFKGPGSHDLTLPVQMTPWNFRKARLLLDDHAFGKKPLIPKAWQKRFNLPAKRWLTTWKSFHLLRRFIPDEIDINQRISLFNLHPASQLAGANNDDQHLTVDSGICVLCLQSVKEDFEHLLSRCVVSRMLWQLSQPPHAIPDLSELICPSLKSSLVIISFRAIFVCTIWRWARARRFNNYGQAPQPVSELDILTRASKVHLVWNRHSFVSAAEKKQAKAVARPAAVDSERLERTLALLPFGA